MSGRFTLLLSILGEIQKANHDGRTITRMDLIELFDECNNETIYDHIKRLKEAGLVRDGRAIKIGPHHYSHPLLANPYPHARATSLQDSNTASVGCDNTSTDR